MTGIKEFGRKGAHARLSNHVQKKNIAQWRHRNIGTSEKLPEMPQAPKIAENEHPHSSVSPCLRGEESAASFPASVVAEPGARKLRLSERENNLIDLSRDA
jgi:hypothetical protein